MCFPPVLPWFILTHVMIRFETVEAAERCIVSLRRYRNLHPTFSKVCHPCFSFGLRPEVNGVAHDSKSTRFQERLTRKVLFPVQSPGLARGILLIREMVRIQRRWVQMQPSRRKWRAFRIQRVPIFIWKGMFRFVLITRLNPDYHLPPFFSLPLSIDEPVRSNFLVI